MNKKLTIILAILGSLGLLFFDFTLSLGWFVGWMSLLVLSYVRNAYYSSILNEDDFSVRRYIAYIVFVFVILWVGPIVAFIYPEVINPFSLIATYFIDRFILYIRRIFKKESVYVSK